MAPLAPPRRRPGHSFAGLDAAPKCPRGDTLLLYEAIMPAVPVVVGQIRHELDAALTGVEVAPARRGDIALAVTEAMTNAVLHAYRGSSPGPLYVAGGLSDRSLLLTVSDCGRGMSARTDRPDLGAGLRLIGRLADGVRIADDPGERGTRLSIVFREATTEEGARPFWNLLHGGIPVRADADVRREYVDVLALTGALDLDGTALLREAERALAHAKRLRRRTWVA